MESFLKDSLKRKVVDNIVNFPASFDNKCLLNSILEIKAAAQIVWNVISDFESVPGCVKLDKTLDQAKNISNLRIIERDTSFFNRCMKRALSVHSQRRNMQLVQCDIFSRFFDGIYEKYVDSKELCYRHIIGDVTNI